MSLDGHSFQRREEMAASKEKIDVHPTVPPDALTIPTDEVDYGREEDRRDEFRRSYYHRPIPSPTPFEETALGKFSQAIFDKCPILGRWLEMAWDQFVKPAGQRAQEVERKAWERHDALVKAADETNKALRTESDALFKEADVVRKQVQPCRERFDPWCLQADLAKSDAVANLGIDPTLDDLANVVATPPEPPSDGAVAAREGLCPGETITSCLTLGIPVATVIIGSIEGVSFGSLTGSITFATPFTPKPLMGLFYAVLGIVVSFCTGMVVKALSYRGAAPATNTEARFRASRWSGIFLGFYAFCLTTVDYFGIVRHAEAVARRPHDAAGTHDDLTKFVLLAIGCSVLSLGLATAYWVHGKMMRWLNVALEVIALSRETEQRKLTKDHRENEAVINALKAIGRSAVLHAYRTSAIDVVQAEVSRLEARAGNLLDRRVTAPAYIPDRAVRLIRRANEQAIGVMVFFEGLLEKVIAAFQESAYAWPASGPERMTSGSRGPSLSDAKPGFFRRLWNWLVRFWQRFIAWITGRRSHEAQAEGAEL